MYSQCVWPSSIKDLFWTLHSSAHTYPLHADNIQEPPVHTHTHTPEPVPCPVSCTRRGEGSLFYVCCHFGNALGLKQVKIIFIISQFCFKVFVLVMQ